MSKTNHVYCGVCEHLDLRVSIVAEIYRIRLTRSIVSIIWDHKPTPPPPPLFDKFKLGLTKCKHLLNTHKTELVHCNSN